jgi:SpoVK/Ycf46/Vps4 family AAA+-type ATPase
MAAMTSNQIGLIYAITQNDMPKARTYARMCVAEDESKKNAAECKRLARLLDPAQNPDLEKLPYKIEGMLEVEHPRESFQVARYYLSPREAELFGRIDRERKVCDALMAMRIRRTNTTLIYGESGTGKTMFGRFVAAMFDLPFYYINFARLVDSLMGKTSQNIAAIFDYVHTTPCVLMLDEIDTVSTERKGGGDGVGGELNRVTVTLMQEFDKLQNTQIVIGASNRLDIIDRALLRRFSRVHETRRFARQLAELRGEGEAE